MTVMSRSPCRVVLVRPNFAANVGATARVMRNMGLDELVLVQPLANPVDREARRLATHGEAILHRARVVEDLGAAVADCVFVAATSARAGGPVRRQSVAPPDEVLAELVGANRSGPVALVFGSEPSGLTDAEVSRCHYLIRIPADPAYPVLNLAQAVAVCLYEWRRQSQLLAGPPAQREPPAPFASQERMFESLRAALEEIHFLYGPKADALMHALRHLIGRAGPTHMEVEVLLGLARQIRWYTAHRGAPSPRQETLGE